MKNPLDYLTLDEELKSKINDLFNDLKNSEDDILVEIGELLLDSLNAYAGNEITKDELKEFIQDTVDLQLADYHKDQVEMKVKVEKYANLITKLILEQLMKLI